jgi:hypothetical protein
MTTHIRKAFKKEFLGVKRAKPTEVSIHKEIQNFAALVASSTLTKLIVPIFPDALDNWISKKRPKLKYKKNSAGLDAAQTSIWGLLTDKESMRFVSILTGISVPITTRLITNSIFGDDDIDKITDDYGVLNFDSIYTDESVVNMLMNGYCPVQLKELEDNLYSWEESFDKYEFGNQIRFPNVKIILEKQSENSLVLKEITLTEKDKQPVISSPSQKDWFQAKKIAWGVVQYDGILRFHSGLCHMLIEQNMMCVNRNLSLNNPVSTLLSPHFKHVRATNFLADHLVWGPHQLTVAFGPFTHESSGTFILDYLQEIDWKTWEPIESIGKFHRYADAGKLFLDVLDGYLDDYFHNNSQEILNTKQDFFHASKELTQHSLTNSKGKSSSSPLLSEQDSDQQILDNLKKFCRFNIFQICFAHCWSHLALAQGYPLNPFAEKYDYQNIKRASKGMQIAQATHFAHKKKGGLPKMMDQGDGRIGKQFLDLLEEKREGFADLGLDIDYLLDSLV